MLRFDPFAILGLDDRHPGGTPEDLGQHAVTAVRQMCNDNERQSVIGGYRSEQLL